MDKTYTSKDIQGRDEITAIQQTPGQFIGSTETPTRLLEEILDNSLDEVQAGFGDIIGVFIDTKKGEFSVLDNARGYPFDETKELLEDSPVYASTKLFTSGKFNKNDSSSPYQIASGLHGVGTVACFALSEYMSIEIYRDGKHAKYEFKNGSLSDIKRTVEPFTDKKPFSTKVTIKPNSKFFKSMNINLDFIEERLVLSCANIPNLKVAFIVDGKNKVIKGSENDLIEKYLSTYVDDWYIFDNRNRKGEKYYLKFGWEDGKFNPLKSLTTVNLIRVHDGVHLNKLLNVLRDLFQYYGKKYNYHFERDDIFQGCRIYLSLSIIQTSFAAQVKTTLESSSDISILDNLESSIKSYFNNNQELLKNLLERFQTYRQALQSKKLVKHTTKKKRGSTKFTKLKDCEKEGGELIIGEGDSAVNGLITVRDPEKHAILPLRGVIPNVTTKERKKLLENKEVKDIIESLGVSIGEENDTNGLRYSKVIIACDADPAGHHITSLLIALFAVLVPVVIKQNKLFVARTPLYAVRRNKQFVPLWTQVSVDEARNNKEKIMRFKGLGEFTPKDLYEFTLGQNRQLIPVTWSIDYERLLNIFSDSSEKRKLVLGEWKLKEDET